MLNRELLERLRKHDAYEMKKAQDESDLTSAELTELNGLMNKYGVVIQGKAQ